MNNYTVTSVAGKQVAGLRNPGEGETIRLTEEQAAQPLRLGYISGPTDSLDAPLFLKSRSKKRS